MELVTCEACDAPISREARACPRCGHPGPINGTTPKRLAHSADVTTQRWALAVAAIVRSPWFLAACLVMALAGFFSAHQATGDFRAAGAAADAVDAEHSCEDFFYYLVPSPPSVPPDDVLNDPDFAPCQESHDETVLRQDAARDSESSAKTLGWVMLAGVAVGGFALVAHRSPRFQRRRI